MRNERRGEKRRRECAGYFIDRVAVSRQMDFAGKRRGRSRWVPVVAFAH